MISRQPPERRDGANSVRQTLNDERELKIDSHTRLFNC